MNNRWLALSVLALSTTLVTAPSVVEAATYKQCVKGKFGVGYVAKVKWYDSTKIKLNGKKLVLPTPSRTRNVAVTENDCYSSSKPHFMTVEAIGNEAASHVIAGISGTLTGIAGVGLCIGIGVAGAPSATGPCAELAIDGAILAGTAIKAALPDPGIFFKGYAKQIELTGTVWNPKAKITSRLNGINETNVATALCLGLKNAGTKDKLTFEFFEGKKSLGKSTSTGCNTAVSAGSAATKKMTHFYISTSGEDATWLDFVKLSGQWSGEIADWGRIGGKGYCLSTDPKDGSSWIKANKIDKRGCYKKFRFDVAKKTVSGSR